MPTMPRISEVYVRRFVDGFYPIHTGEAGGIVGRILSLSVGVWLAAMLGLGILLWQRRRAGRQAWTQ